MANEQKPAAPQAPASPALPSTFKPSGPPASQPQSAPPAPEQRTISSTNAPAVAAADDAVKVQIVAEPGAATPPTQAAPDGTDPSKYPADGTAHEGLMGGTGVSAPMGESPSGAVLDGNPPAYDAEAKHGLAEEPTFPKRVVQHCKMEDFAEGGTVYKLGVSHPPYIVETVGKGLVVLRAGTGGTVQITNNSEASFYTNDQSRQYGVADGSPNTSGDVKAP